MRINHINGSLENNGKVVRMARQEYFILCYLEANKGKYISVGELAEKTFFKEATPGNVKVVIKRIKDAMREVGLPAENLLTVRRISPDNDISSYKLEMHNE